MKKGWLPPSYGKVKYNDMSKEEKIIIDEFEGKEVYNKVVNQPNKYIYNIKNILMLGEAI
jgi:ribonuclease HIII